MSQENLNGTTTPSPTELFSKETFLTSLRGGGDNSNDLKIVVEEPQSMAIVREKHAQLHEVVGSLSEKISAVLGRQERDFLAAYRAHMYNVQKELHEMREKMQRNETAENKTEKIKKIEEERDWYRKEALRLDSFTANMTKDLKYMKEKLGSIEEDRNWLEKQLKACKKQNKLLRAELDVRISNGTNGSSLFNNPGDLLPPFDSPTKNTKRQSMTGKKSPDATESDMLPYLNTDNHMIAEERENKYKLKVKQLKKELQNKSRELHLLKKQHHSHDTQSELAHLENFFLQCVDSVKDEVQKRRVANVDASIRKEREKATRATNLKANGHYDVGAEFEDFTSSDRVRVIERLLGHDQVLSFLYEHLFPAKLSFNEGNDPESTRIFTEEYTTPTSNTAPVGSGAAVASAVRGSGGFLIDDFTKQYLRSTRS